MGLRIAYRVLSRLPGFLGRRSEAGEAAGGLEARPKPLWRSVRWVPVDLPEFDRPADRDRPFELFVAQPVFRRARSGLTGSGERFGFLLGSRFWCPDARVPWVLISEASPPAASLPARGEEREFERLRRQAGRGAAARGLELVGWYQEHRYLGVALTTHEVTLHRQSFPEPWHCALIFVSGRPASSGAFIQPWRGELHFGRALVSFQELIEPGEEAAPLESPPQLPPFSTVDWRNYAPERPVQRGERLVLDGGITPAPAEPEPDGSPAVAFRLHSRTVAERSARARSNLPEDGSGLHRPPRLDIPILLPRPERPQLLRERLTAWMKEVMARF